jgi:5-methylcytosine-specific restriction endonuclease McrA
MDSALVLCGLLAVFVKCIVASEGPFNPESYKGTSKKNHQVGDIVYVISADAPRRPQYHGLYEIIDIKEQQDGIRNINFRPIVQPPKKILLNDMDWFDNNYFHNTVAFGGNFAPINDVNRERFDQLLRDWNHRGDAIDDLESGRNNPESYIGKRYPRDQKVRDKVLRRAAGKCEFCGEIGFETKDHGRYLETHHIIRLADDGADLMSNVIALCPDHHRQAHYGLDRDELETKMAEIVQSFE